MQRFYIRTCPDCNGSGRLDTGTQCDVCHGSGKVGCVPATLFGSGAQSATIDFGRPPEHAEGEDGK